MKRYLGVICVLLAITGAGFAGWVDFNNDEPQAAVLVILVMTILLGMLSPKRAWLWGIIAGLGIPVMYLVLHSLGYQPASPPSPAWYASLIALIPATLGAYIGAAGRWVLNKAIASS